MSRLTFRPEPGPRSSKSARPASTFRHFPGARSPSAGAIGFPGYVSFDLMANPFPRTTRSLRGEEGLSHLLFPAACTLLLIVWALWLVRARFPVYVASE